MTSHDRLLLLLLALAEAVLAPTRGIADESIEPWRLDVRRALAGLKVEMAAEEEPDRG